MRVFQSAAWLAAVVLTGCSERISPTAPASQSGIAAAGLTGDRPYTWSLKCAGDFSSDASWGWTAGGVSIVGASLSETNCVPGQTASGSGVRPASADGFSACVNYVTCQSWTFDPTASLRAQLKGVRTIWDSARCGSYDPFKNQPASCFYKATGQLNVDS